MMPNQSFVIEGGHPITGRIRPSGNKNAALPLIAAALLTDDEVVLENVPDIGDVETLLSIMTELGVTVSERGQGVIALRADGVLGDRPNAAACQQIRASVLLAGPLLTRCGRVHLPLPGGDVIGRRRIDTHVLALKALGASVEVGEGEYLFESRGRLEGAAIFLDETSVTATENAIMAAALAQGTTTIDNAASEPHVQDLCRLLVAMGGRIEGIGSNRLFIEGRDRLGGASYRLGPDYIEVGSLITLAAVTGGELTIEDARPEEHRATQLAFQRLGIRFTTDVSGRHIVVPKDQQLTVTPDLGGAIPKIEDSPWPGFPADLTSLAIVGATQSEGTVLVFEKMFESRLFFVDRLAAMGARLILCDPHRVVITGRAQLIAQELTSPDIRAGMALLVAALCAQGTSRIHNIGQIDRGYERIDERLAQLGANITRSSA